MDGITMLKKIRQDNWGKGVRVIILSNLSNPDREQEARELGVKDYIIKADWKIEDIMEKVGVALGE
jgi:CheY-like chemotaxis protein